MRLKTQPTIRDSRNWSFNERASREQRQAERVRLRAKDSVRTIFGAVIIAVVENPQDVKSAVRTILGGVKRQRAVMTEAEALRVLGLD